MRDLEAQVGAERERAAALEAELRELQALLATRDNTDAVEAAAAARVTARLQAEKGSSHGQGQPAF